MLYATCSCCNSNLFSLFVGIDSAKTGVNCNSFAYHNRHMSCTERRHPLFTVAFPQSVHVLTTRIEVYVIRVLQILFAKVAAHHLAKQGFSKRVLNKEKKLTSLVKHRSLGWIRLFVARFLKSGSGHCSEFWL